MVYFTTQDIEVATDKLFNFVDEEQMQCCCALFQIQLNYNDISKKHKWQDLVEGHIITCIHNSKPDSNPMAEPADINSLITAFIGELKG